MAKANKPKRVTAKEKEQLQFKEVADEKNPKVHKAAIDLQDKIDESKLAKKAEKEANAKLLFIMHQEKVPAYRFGDIDAKIKVTEKATVKKVAAKREKKPRKKKGEVAPAEEAKAA